MYAKIFRQMFYGSMYAKGDEQLVFVCLLAHADRDGNVELPPQMIASMTGMDLPRVTAALEALQAPDPSSRRKEDDGRRVEGIGDGFSWHIVNYLHYRAMRDDDARREQTRKAVTRHRDKKMKATVSRGKPRKAHAEADAEVDVETDKTCPVRPDGVGDSPSEEEDLPPDRWFDEVFYPEYPRREGRLPGQRACVALFRAVPKSRHDELAEKIMLRLLAYRREVEGKERTLIKLPATFLNAKPWED